MVNRMFPFPFFIRKDVSIPVIFPTKSFAFLLLKNEPCVQSWKMINVRTTKPAATILQATVNQGENCNK